MSLLRRITRLFRPFQCYQVLGNLLVCHDLTAGIITVVHLPLPVHSGGQYCQVSKGTVLTLGGFPCERKVVYVFGGMQGGRAISACEQLQRNPVQWTSLPSLPFSSLYRFSTCLYRGQFYLPICTQSPFLSIFSPISLSFHQISLLIPVLQGNSTALIVHNELIVVCECRWVARWRLGSAEGFKVREIERSVGNFSVESLLVQVGEVIYWLKMAYFIKTDWNLRPIAEEQVLF